MDATRIDTFIQQEKAALAPQYKDLLRFFTTATTQQCSTLNGKEITLWQVFKKDEYMIMYSDQKKIYGLAFNNIVNDLIYLGGSGTLTDAIEALLRKDDE